MADRVRLLVIANETLADSSVVEQVRARAGEAAADVLVVAPMLPRSRLAHMLGTEDERDRVAAGERLEATVAALADAGMEATGEVGDGDPLQALDDAMRTFRPDEVVISTHVPERSGWLERDVVRRARSRYLDTPITHLVVDIGRGLERIDAPHATGGVREERVTVYHAAPYEEALAIRERGFRDEGAQRGVSVVDAPAAAAAEGGVVLAVEVPAEALEGRQGGSEEGWLLPAEYLNRFGPAVTVDDWSE